MNHCLIPAKSKSIRIPNKNFNDFCGRPILNIPLLNVIESDSFDTISIFTDDPKKVNSNIEFSDPKRYEVVLEDKKRRGFSDRTLTNVVSDFLTKTKLYKGKLGVILPTSVFISSIEINSITRIQSSSTVFAAKKITKKALNTYVNNFKIGSSKNSNAVSQHQPQPFVDAGQFYWIDIESFIFDNQIILDRNAIPYDIGEEVIDIDTPEDWEKAETDYIKSGGSFIGLTS